MTDNGEAVPSRRLLTRSTSYIPYGEVFVEESSTGWQSPFYFNSKELDEETGLYYYGARYLNPTEERWLSVDPMFEKYVGMSPYNYCAGNPVKLVDVDGRENTIYLVYLQNKQDAQLDTKNFINTVNEKFEQLGLKTRMKISPDGANFDPQNIDKTDSYVVIGGRDEVKSYMKKINSDFPEIADWGGGEVNPERSAIKGSYKSGRNIISGEKRCGVAIDINAAFGIAHEYNASELEYSAFLTLHGLGHNATIRHTTGPENSIYTCKEAMIMAEGTWIKNNMNFFFKSINEVMKLNVITEYGVYSNSGYVQTIKRYFGDNSPVDNYISNKKKR